jgi:hypothetical protein
MGEKFFKNIIINMERSFFSLSIVLFYSIYLFVSFFSNKNFDEEFVYFFIVLIVSIFSLKIFQEIFNFLIQTRTNIIYKQLLDTYTLNVGMLNNLILIEKDNISFKIYIYEFFKGFIEKFFYFIFFYNKFFINRILLSFYISLLLSKLNYLVKKTINNIDKISFFNDTKIFKSKFFNYVKLFYKFIFVIKLRLKKKKLFRR